MDSRTALMAPGHRPAWSPWSVSNRLEAPVEAIGFWAAMGLPVVYLSLLVSGIEGRTGLVLFLGLFGLHVMALIVGHDYQPDRTRAVQNRPPMTNR